MDTYSNIISVNNLLTAWKEFLRGKKKRKDVNLFSLHLMDNIFNLHEDLKNKKYRHNGYEAFGISDPKPRKIHKATVRDRLVHHALYSAMAKYFDQRFIHDSYSCRLNKGTHRALGRFKIYSNKVSKNDTRTCWILKCDIRKFFASVDQGILMSILEKYISDKEILWIIANVINSFHSTASGKGLPLGNLTSQLLVNIYMNEFDQFIKHRLKIKYYIRYADDFVVLDSSRENSENLIIIFDNFLKENLKLELHPCKVSIETLASGVDFLGWVHFPHHRVLRTVTKKRMMKKIRVDYRPEVVASYLGMLEHGNAYILRKNIKNIVKLNKIDARPK